MLSIASRSDVCVLALTVMCFASACVGEVQQDSSPDTLPNQTSSGEDDSAGSSAATSASSVTHDVTHGAMDHAGGTHVAVTGNWPKGDVGVAGPQVMATSEEPADGGGTGAFRTRCNFSHMNMDDPIVYPGQPGASHLHAFFGNTGTDAYSTADSILNTGNSTCRGGTLNRTAYWAPALIDASGQPVAPIEIDVYYKTGYGGVVPDEIQPLPEGLRMIAGDAKASSAQPYSYWGCKDNYVGKPANIVDCASTDLVMMVVIFPQCWDGSQLDSADHKSHLAYPGGSGCPSTHPVSLPEVTFKIYYAQPAGGTAGYRLASDMYEPAKPGGMSAHADYFAGWDKDTQAAFIRNCDERALDCHSHLLGDGRMLY